MISLPRIHPLGMPIKVSMGHQTPYITEMSFRCSPQAEVNRLAAHVLQKADSTSVSSDPCFQFSDQGCVEIRQLISASFSRTLTAQTAYVRIKVTFKDGQGQVVGVPKQYEATRSVCLSLPPIHKK